MRAFVLVLVAVLGCQTKDSRPPAQQQGAGSAVKTADDCQRFFDRARPTLQAMASAAGMPLSPSTEQEGLRDCRADLAAGKRPPLIDCVLAAKDQAGVNACFPRYEELTRRRGDTGAPADVGAAAGSGASPGSGSSAGSGASAASAASAGRGASAGPGASAGSGASAHP